MGTQGGPFIPTPTAPGTRSVGGTWEVTHSAKEETRDSPDFRTLPSSPGPHPFGGPSETIEKGP